MIQDRPQADRRPGCRDHQDADAFAHFRIGERYHAGHLDIGMAIHVSDLEIPEGMRVEDAPEELIVQVIKPQEVEEEAEGVPGPAEPEVIGRKAAEESDEK